MALTVTRTSETVGGNRRHVIGTITFDSAYADNGEAITPANVGLSSIKFLHLTPAVKSDGSAVVIPAYDRTNGKVLAFWSAGSAAVSPEVTSTTDLSTYTCQFLAVGN